MLKRVLIPFIFLVFWQFYARAQVVIVSENGGIYNEPLSVTLSGSDPEAFVYFTLDGSAPDKTDRLYVEPLIIDSTTILKAVSVSPDGMVSELAANSYLFTGRAHALPVLSLSADPEAFFSDSSGIYVVGKNGVTGYCNYLSKRNYCRDWERPAYFEYFSADGTLLYKANAGVKIHGNCSRNFPQRSFALFARKKYGDKNFKYPFFNSKSIDKFEALLLRNSGNDNLKSMMRDALMSRLLEDESGIGYQGYNPVAVYLNGEYWGLYNMREKLNEHFVAENHGVDPDNIDMLENLDEVTHGDKTHIDSLMAFVNHNNLDDDNNWQALQTMMDVEEFTGYMVAEIYSGNTDWPVNNVRYWRERTPAGRWRWIIYDTDLGFSYQNGGYGNDLFNKLKSWTGNENTANTVFLFNRLMQTKRFRQQFTEYLFYELNTRFSERKVKETIASVAGAIAGEMAWHTQRWKKNYADWEEELVRMNRFAELRVDYVTEHFRNYVTLVETNEFVIKNDSLNPLQILINGKPFSGKVFKAFYEAGTELELIATEHLQHWLVNGERVETSDTLTLVINEHTTINPISVYATSLDKTSTVPQINVFPNPADKTMYVQSTSEIQFFEICNTNGKHYPLQCTDMHRLNVSHLSSGMYILTLHCLSGEIVRKKVLVK